MPRTRSCGRGSCAGPGGDSARPGRSRVASTTMLPSLDSCANRCISCRASLPSTLLLGSSQSSRLGRVITARATATSWRWPMDRSRGRASDDLAQPQPAHHLGHDPADLRILAAIDAQRQRDVVERRQMVEQARGPETPCRYAGAARARSRPSCATSRWNRVAVPPTASAAGPERAAARFCPHRSGPSGTRTRPAQGEIDLAQDLGPASYGLRCVRAAACAR